MSSDVAQLIEYNTQDVVKIIMHERGCSAVDAMREFYASKTFEGLVDPETGLYLQSPSYLYAVHVKLIDLGECAPRK
ncbi:hypothetical protein [Adlercreutzia sp. ZJ473]|uniref:hypothetical protein n=1 Tax=Adlercreutzia sp. ZJ473 TaxID=2722822 RepID=UPI0015544C7F|nr:hypothetical protein [Adlercreutzia sp. ZJ473]